MGLKDTGIAGEPLGRVKMELFADVTPRTAENFRQFCTGESKDIQGRPQGYKNSKFHRVVRDDMLNLKCFVATGTNDSIWMGRSRIS